MFGEKFLGRRFIRNGRCFTVLAVEPYPDDKVTPRHREILGLAAGQLVAVPYRGALIPNITLGRRGVVRLTAIEMGGKVLGRPGKISAALEINQAYRAYTISES